MEQKTQKTQKKKLGTKMPVKAGTLESITIVDVNVVREALSSVTVTSLSPERQHMLRAMRAAWGLMERYPGKQQCANHLAELLDIPKSTAWKYVDFARKTWGDLQDVTQSFLSTYLTSWLMKMISDPGTSDAVRAKCLATLEKHYANLPKSDVNPETVGAKQVYIQFNVNGVNYSLPQSALARLGIGEKEEMLDALAVEVDETQAEAIMES